MTRGSLFKRKPLAAFWNSDLYLAWGAEVENLVIAVQDSSVLFQRLLSEQGRAGTVLNDRCRKRAFGVSAVSSPKCGRELAIPNALLSSSADASNSHGRVAFLLCNVLS